MKNFPVFHPPMLCCFLKFLIVAFLVFGFYPVTVAVLLMPIGKSYFQISLNWGVFIIYAEGWGGGGGWQMGKGNVWNFLYPPQ